MQDLWADTSLICRITWHRRWFWQKMVVVARPINCPGCISSIVPCEGQGVNPTERSDWQSFNNLHFVICQGLRNLPVLQKTSGNVNFISVALFGSSSMCFLVFFFSFLDTRLSSTIETHWVISYLNSPNKYKN